MHCHLTLKKTYYSPGSIFIAEKYGNKGCQTYENLWEPLIEHVIFSKCRYNIRCWSQYDALGGFVDFQCNKICLRANKDAKAIMFSCLWVKLDLSSGTPNIANSTHGFSCASHTLESVSHMVDQLAVSVGEVQNMWFRSASPVWHLIQVLSKIGLKDAILVLLKCIPCNTLNCIKFNRA